MQVVQVPEDESWPELMQGRSGTGTDGPAVTAF